MTKPRAEQRRASANLCPTHHWKIEATDENPAHLELLGYCIRCRLVRYFPREQAVHYNGVRKPRAPRPTTAPRRPTLDQLEHDYASR